MSKSRASFVFCCTLFVVLALLSSRAQAGAFVSVEGSASWQSRNDQRIPGEGGTDFALTDFGRGPFGLYRVYAGYVWDDKHELRLLYAPLEVELRGRFSNPVLFINSTFAAGTETVGLYRFNSYRLTYARHFEKSGPWRLTLGFTAKIRDAEVRLTQGTLSQSKTNVGFVPLLNFRATRDLAPGWLLRFDVDGLAAPQGRAFDAALFLERSLGASGLSAFGGYRMVEGGADNSEVYNFAWFHSAVLGLRGEI
ncbi:MAG: hypothetical protein ACK5QT_05325 [Oligoflexia bacterium]